MNQIADDIKRYLKDPYYLAFLFILAAAAYLRFEYAFFEGLWVDEGRYGRSALAVSSHLLSFSGIDAWKGQITSFPPVYTYLLALSTYVFGKTELAIRVVSPIMGVAGVALTYFLGREIKNREVGLIAAALIAVNPVFWFLSERVLIGATFATLYTAAIFCLYYGLEQRKYSRYALWSLGPLIALNIMTKQPAYTLGLVIPLYFIYKKRGELRQLLFEDVRLKESSAYQKTLMNRDYYVAIGLGIATLTPWILRNLAVCSAPLCGLSRATKFAQVSSAAEWASTGGPFYFISNMPAVVTIPVSLLILFRIGQYLIDWTEKDEDMLVKYSALTLALVGASYLVAPRLVPMVLLTSIAFHATNDAEKLLWLWIGIGVGFMSIPQIKVPRYIVFTIPALVMVAGLALYSISNWLSRQLELKQLSAPKIATLMLLPILLISFSQGLQNISKGGFEYLEPAGEWLDSNTPEDAVIVASSPAQTRYYTYPRMAYRMPENESEFRSFLAQKNISYVEIDVYERAQPKWAQTSLPPYRLPVSTVNDLKSGQKSGQEVVDSYGQPPKYLEPVKSFGRARVPLLGKKQLQPMVVIYRVNQSVL